MTNGGHIGPDPTQPHPLDGHNRVGFLKPLISASNIEVGDYTYYDDPNGPELFEKQNVLYHYDFVGDRLIIGRFCALASGVTFIMNGANHAMDGFSTFPFNIFGKGWEEGFDPQSWNQGYRGDTIVENDVWIGRNATIMPGVQIGNGAIIASGSVVTEDIMPFTIVGGNPSKTIRRRFNQQTIDDLLDIAWWNWDNEKLSRNLNAIRGADIQKLKEAK